MIDDLAVNEIFGPTVQGEGPLLGRPCCFVRLARCDLTCSWCDTPYTWDWRGVNGVAYDPKTEIHRRTVDAVVAEVDALDPPRNVGVVVSGGEPMLQSSGLTALCAALVGAGRWVQIETNGRHAPHPNLPDEVMIVASPKLANSGIRSSLAIVPGSIRALEERGTHFKFVVESLACLDEVSALVATHRLTNVWVMPQGTTNAVIAQHQAAMASAAIARGFNLTTRLHIQLWGQRRAV